MDNRRVTRSMKNESMEQADGMNKPQSKEKTNNKCSNLQHMMGDCLVKVFSVMSLDLMDLCSIAETCTKFQQIVQSMVSNYIYVKTTNSCRPSYHVEFGKWKSSGNQEYIQRIFKNFRSNFSAIKIQSWATTNDNRFVMDLVTNGCNEHLKSLEMRFLKLVDTVKFVPIFKQLHKLDLNFISISAETKLFTALESLVELRVAHVVTCREILGSTFPKLERFYYKKQTIVMDSVTCDAEQTLATLLSFFPLNKKLKQLTLQFACDGSCQIAILKAVGNSCKELEKLDIDLAPMSDDYEIFLKPSRLQPLQTFKSLNALKLVAVSFHDFKLFTQMVQLRELHLSFCKLPKDCHQFSALSQLTKLKIIERDNSTDLIGIISRLLNLKVLSCQHYLSLDEKTFRRILAIIIARPNVLTLECHFDFNVKNYENQRAVKFVCL